MNPSSSPLRHDAHRLLWRFKDQLLWLEPWGPDSIRVRATVLSEMPQRDWSLLPAKPSSPKFKIDAKTNSAQLINGRLTATIDAKGRVRFFKDGSKEPLVEEIFARTNYPPGRTFKSVGGDLSLVEASFTAFDDERVYGPGQRRHGLLNQKGCVLELVHRNSQVSIPFLVSSRGYGFLWHHPGVGRVELGRTQTRWVADTSRLIDYVVTTGDSYADILERY